MKMFLFNIALAFLWAVLTGAIDSRNLVVGFVIGYFILGVVNNRQETVYFKKIRQAIRFLALFLREMIVSSVRVAWDVVTPTYHMKPGVIAIPLDAETDTEITLLANVISLTPGTLSLDVSEDRRLLYIHAMFIDDPDSLRREIKEELEKPLLELLR